MISNLTAVALRWPVEAACDTALAVVAGGLNGIGNTCPADGGKARDTPGDGQGRGAVTLLVPLALGAIYTLALGAAWLRCRAPQAARSPSCRIRGKALATTATAGCCCPRRRSICGTPR